MLHGSPFEQAKILVADGNTYSRGLIRMMLTNIGARTIFEASDGADAIEAIQSISPDLMIMNWDIPLISAPELMRIVRSPDTFPKADLPILMVTEIAWESRVDLAISLGVHEILASPMSCNTMKQRIWSMLRRPRPMIRAGDHFVPMPRENPRWKSLLAAAHDTQRDDQGAGASYLI